MSNTKTARSALAFIAALLLSAGAQAQLFRSYVSVGGNDGNPCTLPAPCRLLPAALSAVASGGEIWMLDSANYNGSTVDVTKSVTILAVPGVVGSVVAPAAGGGPAIRVNTAGVKLALRNLVIVPLPGAAGSGIVMHAGAALTVDNCLIANMPVFGIVVDTNAVVRITDTTIRDNLLHGVSVGGGARATITRSKISGNTAGVGVFAYVNVSSPETIVDIADSTLDGNQSGFVAFTDSVASQIYASISGSRIVQNNTGISANGGSAGTAVLSANNNTISHNSLVGVVAYNAGGKVVVSGNTVNQNEKGLWAATGVIESAGNNTVRDNTTDTVNTIGSFTQK